MTTGGDPEHPGGGGGARRHPRPSPGSSGDDNDDAVATALAEAAAAAAAAGPTEPVYARSSFYAAALAASSNLSEYAPFLPSDSSNNGSSGAPTPDPSRAGSGVTMPPVPLPPGRGSIVNEDRVGGVAVVDPHDDPDRRGVLPVASFYPGDLTPRQVSEDPDVLMDALAAANRRRAEEAAGGGVAAAAAGTASQTDDLMGDDEPASPAGGGAAAAAGGRGDDDGGPDLDENLLMQYQIEAQCQAAVLCERNTGYNPMTADRDEGSDDDDNNDNDPSSAAEANGDGGGRRRSSLPERQLVAPPPEVKLPELFGDTFQLKLIRPSMPVPTKRTGVPVPPRPEGPELVVGTWIASLREAREIVGEGADAGGDGDGDGDDGERDDEGGDGEEKKWSVDRLPWVVKPRGSKVGDGDDADGGADGERKEGADGEEDEGAKERDERFVLGADERAARCLGCGGLLRVPGSASLATCPQCRTVSPAHWARTLALEAR